jgi:hypothetical protein
LRLRDATGRMEGMAAVLRDVTRRFEELRALRRRVAAAQEGSPAAPRPAASPGLPTS